MKHDTTTTLRKSQTAIAECIVKFKEFAEVLKEPKNKEPKNEDLIIGNAISLGLFSQSDIINLGMEKKIYETVPPSIKYILLDDDLKKLLKERVDDRLNKFGEQDQRYERAINTMEKVEKDARTIVDEYKNPSQNKNKAQTDKLHDKLLTLSRSLGVLKEEVENYGKSNRFIAYNAVTFGHHRRRWGDVMLKISNALEKVTKSFEDRDRSEGHRDKLIKELENESASIMNEAKKLTGE